ncbi:MAG: S41 family peptidase [Rhizobiales bacterium]|nr:S41 family peptidase [Hyphomicrobiales bacterium]
MKKTLSLGVIFTIIGLILGTFIAPVFSKEKSINIAEQKAMKDEKNYELLLRFGSIFDIIQDEYVDEPDMEKIMEKATKALLSALGPHSEYMNAKEYKELSERTSGSFGGLGIRVQLEDGLVKAIKVLEDTPAMKAGIEDNDIITKIDDTEVMGLTLSEAVDLMRGDVGEPISLLVIRDGEAEPLAFNFKRDIIKSNPVTFEAKGNIGYITLSEFNGIADEKIKLAIDELTKDIGDKLSGFILDLRGNGGGLLDQAVFVSDIFLEDGEIVSTRGRHKYQTDRKYSVTKDKIDGKKLVVLINGSSASSSEIVAGALQDYKRATIIGTRSFGKGSVQTIRDLPNEAGALRLTSARYYTPSGRTIQAKGIAPDWVVEPIIPKELEKRFTEQQSEASLEGHLQNEDKKLEEEENERAFSYVPRDETLDLQLIYALNFLNGEMEIGEKNIELEEEIAKKSEAEWLKAKEKAEAAKENLEKNLKKMNDKAKTDKDGSEEKKAPTSK